jgi:hypothetical protein
VRGNVLAIGSSLALESTLSPDDIYPTVRWDSEPDHSAPSSAVIKDAWSFTSSAYTSSCHSAHPRSEIYCRNCEAYYVHIMLTYELKAFFALSYRLIKYIIEQQNTIDSASHFILHVLYKN